MNNSLKSKKEILIERLTKDKKEIKISDEEYTKSVNDSKKDMEEVAKEFITLNLQSTISASKMVLNS